VAEDGTRWEVFAAAAIVAHGRSGAVLAFRPEGQDVVRVLRSTVTFYSVAAAELAIQSMSEKETARRLELARKAAAGV
jgi:hypothetical protein